MYRNRSPGLYIALQQKWERVLHLQAHSDFTAIYSEDCMLKGKTALVTGSISGIGLAIARALAKDGADVMLKLRNDYQSFELLRTHGQRAARRFLDAHYADIGVKSTVELGAEVHAERG